MCVKFPHRDLNPNHYLPHPTSTYTCGVTTAPKVCGGPFPPLVLLSPHTLKKNRDVGI